MERQSKGSRGLEAYCKGGQGPPRAVAPPKKKKSQQDTLFLNFILETALHVLDRLTVHHQESEYFIHSNLAQVLADSQHNWYDKYQLL